MLLNLDKPLRTATLHLDECSQVTSPVGTPYKPLGSMGRDGGWFKVASLAEADTLVRGLPWASLHRCTYCHETEASTDPGAWTDEELRASVAAYLGMLDQSRVGIPVVKKHVYSALAERFGRTTKAFEYRMQNISYVFSLLGRPWVPGLKPAKNVGANVAAKIEALIAELEGRSALPVAAFEVEVDRARKKPTPKPVGIKKPKATTVAVTQFDRDPAVKAWVLNQAKGICECCSLPAPFETVDGPFLEVHHVHRLADGGADTPENAIAICPNCHRRLHHAIDAAALIERLYKKISRLVHN